MSFWWTNSSKPLVCHHWFATCTNEPKTLSKIQFYERHTDYVSWSWGVYHDAPPRDDSAERYSNEPNSHACRNRTMWCQRSVHFEWTRNMMNWHEGILHTKSFMKWPNDSQSRSMLEWRMSAPSHTDKPTVLQWTKIHMLVAIKPYERHTDYVSWSWRASRWCTIKFHEHTSLGETHEYSWCLQWQICNTDEPK